MDVDVLIEIPKALEPGKLVQAGAWAGRSAAEAEIEACRKRFAETADRPE